MRGLASQLRARGHEADSIAVLRATAEALPSLDEPEFAAAFDRYGDARAVLIGEATHGTSEFYRARALITRRLIERHGFNIVAVEADWPDAARIDRHVRQRPRAADDEPAFTRFPGWMWRNAEVREFIDWLELHNARQPPPLRVEFRGLDVYSLRRSIEAVLAYLHRVDPEAAAAARRRYGCLSPWQAEPTAYGRSVLRGLDSCESAVVAQLRELLERRLQYASQDGEEFFEAAQNARTVRAAEQYYRIMYQGSTESWNLRDRHMFETLQRLLERREQGKAVVWAHNSHLGNAAATSMGWAGEFNIGELARKAWRSEAVLIGQGSDRGTVMAADDWDEPAQVMTQRPVRPDSWERRFVDVGQPRTLTDWRGRRDTELCEVLGEVHLQRAIGVIYRPHTERQSHYFEALLGDQFDAWIWFEETQAVTALGPEHLEGVPDTYPFGL
jgi:erythromycin esterase-like protein